MATVDEAFDYCKKITYNHYENFPVASLLIPKTLRPAICAVYAFARTADDFADEKIHEGKRMEKLLGWEGLLKGMLNEEPVHPVFIALKEAVLRFNLPISLFLDLLTAFKMDVNVSRYQTFADVLGYCHFSANPVGRIILHLMGYPAPRLMEYSDTICSALQLANFWQDIAVDLAKNRIYIPEEDFSRFGYSEKELFEKKVNDNFRRLVLFQVERTEEMFDQGKPLCTKIPGRLGFELRLTLLGGLALLQKIRLLNGNVFRERPVIKKGDKAKIVWGALKKSSFSS